MNREAYTAGYVACPTPHSSAMHARRGSPSTWVLYGAIDQFQRNGTIYVTYRAARRIMRRRDGNAYLWIGDQ